MKHCPVLRSLNLIAGTKAGATACVTPGSTLAPVRHSRWAPVDARTLESVAEWFSTLVERLWSQHRSQSCFHLPSLCLVHVVALKLVSHWAHVDARTLESVAGRSTSWFTAADVRDTSGATLSVCGAVSNVTRLGVPGPMLGDVGRRFTTGVGVSLEVTCVGRVVCLFLRMRGAQTRILLDGLPSLGTLVY